MARAQRLFDSTDLPEGFGYREDFLSAAEERSLATRFAAMEFHEMRMRGVAGRRRIIDYGWKYSFESYKATEGWLRRPDSRSGAGPPGL